jgi:hypothetical protein
MAAVMAVMAVTATGTTILGIGTASVTVIMMIAMIVTGTCTPAMAIGIAAETRSATEMTTVTIAATLTTTWRLLNAPNPPRKCLDRFAPHT